MSWRPGPAPTDGGEEREEADPETAALRDRLAAGEHTTGCWASCCSTTGARPSRWWWYFERLKMSEEQLRDEDDEAIGGLTPPARSARQELTSVPMRFPPQSFKLGPGDTLDPVSERGASRSWRSTPSGAR